MADCFDLPIIKNNQDASVQLIKQAIQARTKDVSFDLINRRFSGKIEGRWIHGQGTIRVYIDKKPWLLSMARIEKELRGALKEYII